MTHTEKPHRPDPSAMTLDEIDNAIRYAEEDMQRAADWMRRLQEEREER